MGAVHHLRQYRLPFEAEAFIAAHKDCPNDAALLQELWTLVQPCIWWREEPVQSNDGMRLVLGKQSLQIDSCYVCKGLQQCSRAVVMALTIGAALPDRGAAQCAAGTAVSQQCGRLSGIPCGGTVGRVFLSVFAAAASGARIISHIAL